LQGVIPDELEVVDVTTNKPKEIEPEFVDVVGQISLRTLDKKERQKKQQGPQQQRGGRDQQRGPKPQGSATSATKWSRPAGMVTQHETSTTGWATTKT
jgi:hypothetical protein